MLPGFRFLFAAIMLSMSLLIFGLGAAALLRAAHESFASNSSWRGAPDIPFAQRPDITLPVLATLRVDTNAMEKANDQATVAAVSADRPPPSVEPARNDQVAAVRPLETPPAEIVKPAELPAPTPLAENPPAPEAATPVIASPSPVPSASETTTAADERKLTTAAVSDTALARSEPSKSEPAKSEPAKNEPVESVPAAAQVEPAAAPPANPAIASPATMAAPVTAPADSVAATKIATLGGPPVDITDDAPALEPRKVKLPRARPDQSAIKKRVQARRAMQRRRLAMRARLLLQQQQVNPFGQPQSFAPATAAAASRQ
jgi:hypothetical protein